jgi:hypothetical protein
MTLPVRRGRIVILGLPYFGQMLAGLLTERAWKARYFAHPGRNPVGWLRLLPALARADVVYLIASRVDRGSPQDIFMHLRRKPVVIHWVGTDVLIALEAHEKQDVSVRLVENATHWCDAPWLVDELRPLGVRSEHVALPIPVSKAEPPPLPARLRVLMYLPVDAFDREVFDMETLLRLPREFPDLDFTLVPSTADTLPGPIPPNLELPGWVTDMDALYSRTSVLVRLVSHDGMPFMVMEALSRGRYVIYTYPLPHVTHAAGYEAVASALGDLAARHAAGKLPLNEAGREYVLENFDRETLAANLDRRVSALLD